MRLNTPEQHPNRLRRRNGVIEEAFWLNPNEIRSLQAALDVLLAGSEFKHTPYLRSCLESVRERLVAS